MRTPTLTELSDHFSMLIKAMCPRDAKDFACKRTKTTFIIKEISADCRTNLVQQLCNLPYFSISTDGSADCGKKRQLYPILIRYYNKEEGRILTEVLSIPANPKSSTGVNIFDLLNNELTKRGLSWEKCISFCSDNAPVMMGRKSGVASFILKQNPQTFMNGCTCHLAAIAAKNASKKLDTHPEDLLLDIMYHLSGSSNRTKELADVQEACGQKPQTLLYYCPTRWLSLGKCIPRLLENWEPVREFFRKNCKVQGKRPLEEKDQPLKKKAKV